MKIPKEFHYCKTPGEMLRPVCVECGEPREILYIGFYSEEAGWLIGPDERVCESCAQLRGVPAFEDIRRLYAREAAYES